MVAIKGQVNENRPRRNEHLEPELLKKKKYTYKEVKAFAEKHEVKLRSIIQKLEYLGIPYERKETPPAKRVGRYAQTREQAVQELTKLMKLDDEVGAELMKVRKDALFAMIDAIKKKRK